MSENILGGTGGNFLGISQIFPDFPERVFFWVCFFFLPVPKIPELPVDLQYLPPEHHREEEPEIRKMLLETLMLVGKVLGEKKWDFGGLGTDFGGFVRDFGGFVKNFGVP